jgi:asparagine synthetase B (glutamine-hydrolysing)
MCGFVAVFDRQGRAAGEQAEILTHMAHTLRHRGPDD